MGKSFLLLFSKKKRSLLNLAFGECREPGLDGIARLRSVPVLPSP
jgi:hypothetical protein